MSLIREEEPLGVLLIGNFLSGSGNRGVCEDLAYRLSLAGWHVTTTSCRRSRVLRLLDMLRTAYASRAEYMVAQVDVYSGTAFVWAEMVCWLLRHLHRPYVLTLHGGNLPHFAKRWPGRVRRLLASAASVTTPSNYLKSSMRPYRDGLVVLPNGLDLDRYSFVCRYQTRPHLVWLRAFHRIYNPTLAVEVLAALVPQFPEARLTMVGPDKGDGSLARVMELAWQRGVADRLATPGRVEKSDVPAWLQRGDIFLNTTDVDNTPVSVVEAMACGLPVVSTNVGGLRFLLTDGQDGLLVPPRNAEAMATAVRSILITPRLSKDLSHAARELVETYDWQSVLPRWIQLLTESSQRSTLCT